jgi:hypothetical protein
MEIALVSYKYYSGQMMPTQDSIRRMEIWLEKGTSPDLAAQFVGHEDQRVAIMAYQAEKSARSRHSLSDWYKYFAGKEPSDKALSAMEKHYERSSDSFMGTAARQHRIEREYKKLVEAEARAVRTLYTYPSDGFADGLPIGATPLTAEEFALKCLQAKKSRSSRRREKNRLIKAGIIRLSDDVLYKNVEKATKKRIEYERVYAEFLA